MPGGPRISIPYCAAVAASRSKSGGSVAAGGIADSRAGSASARMKASNVPGSTTSRKRACSELTVNVNGMPRGL
jgi:hypothetical protein